jgi:gliding motility-associated-like protein
VGRDADLGLLALETFAALPGATIRNTGYFRLATLLPFPQSFVMPAFLLSGRLYRTGLLVLLWLLAGRLPVLAVHLLGGELTYKYLDANGPAGTPWRYEIMLRTYYNPTTDPPEQPLPLRIYLSNSGVVQIVGLRRVSSTTLTLPTQLDCGAPPPPIAVGLYVVTVNLPANGGFHAECATGDRVAGLVNVVSSQGVGMRLSVDLLPGTPPNTSPQFISPPVSVICLGTPSLVLNNAFDADGDELEYVLSQPLGEYNTLPYTPGYSAAQPFGAAGRATVNASTGLSTYLGSAQGIFQLAVDVREYRMLNGQRILLGTVHRDMPVVVRACTGAPSRPPAFTAATLAQQAFQLREGQSVTFDVAATDPDGDPLTLTARSVLLDGAGGIDATFGGQQGGASGSVVGQATTKGTGTARATFRLAGCGLSQRQPYEVIVTATDEVCNSQTVVATFLITVTRPAFAGQLSGLPQVCAQSTATYTVAGSNFSAYHWEVAGGQLLGPASGSTVQVLWGPAGDGTVSVGGVTDTGCPTQLVTYPVRVGPGLSVAGPATYCPTAGGSLRYRVAGPDGAYHWTITGGSILRGQDTNEVLLDIVPGATATVLVSSPALSGCTTTLLVSPKDTCLAFYNIITPNGDALNDLFVIHNIDQHPGTQLTIFNRWGREVYHADDYRNTYDGAGSSAGLYYYHCLLANGTIHKGWFELVR